MASVVSDYMRKVNRISRTFLSSGERQGTEGLRSVVS